MKLKKTSAVRILMIPSLLVFIMVFVGMYCLHEAKTRATARAYRIEEEMAATQTTNIQMRLDQCFHFMEDTAQKYKLVQEGVQDAAQREMLLQTLRESAFFYDASFIDEQATQKDRFIQRTEENGFLFCIPVYWNGEMQGTLCANMDEAYFYEQILTKPAGWQGYSFVCNQNGEIIFADTVQESVDIGENIFALFDAAPNHTAQVAEKAREDFILGRSGNEAAWLDGERWHITYCSIHANDWMLVNLLPKNIIKADIAGMTYIAYTISICGIVLLLLMLLHSCLSDRYRRKQILRESADFDMAVSQGKRMIFRYYISEDTAQLAGGMIQEYGATEVAGFLKRAINSGIIAAESVDAFLAFFRQMQQGRSEGSCTVHTYDCKQQTHWIHMDYTLIRNERNEPSHSIVTYFDNTAQHEKEAAYENWQKEMQLLQSESAAYIEADLTLGVIEKSDGFPESVARTTMHQPDLLMKTLQVHPADEKKMISFLQPYRFLTLCKEERNRDELIYRTVCEGEPIWYRASAYSIQNPYTDHIQGLICFSDIHEEYCEKERIEKRAMIDPLTKLLNKEASASRIQTLLCKEKADEASALFVIDLDNFNQVNINKGHLAGDVVLKHLSERIPAVFRQTDVLGRLGGDEFIVFLLGKATVELIEAKAKNLVESLQYWCENILITASVGVAIGHGGEKSYQELLERAMAALHAAKQEGKCSFRIWGVETEDNQPIQPTRDTEVIPIQSAIENMERCVVLVDVQADAFEIRYISQGIRKLANDFVTDLSELKKSILSRIYSEDYGKVHQAIFTACQKETTTEVSYRVGRNGNTWHHLFLVRISVDDKGNCTLVGVVSDITAMLKADEVMKIAEERYRIGLELTKNDIWEVDIPLRTLYLPEKIANTYFGGVTILKNLPESLVSMNILHADAIGTYRRMINDMTLGEDGQQYMLHLRNATGGYVWISIAFRILRDSAGNPRRAIGVWERVENIESQMEAFQQSKQLVEVMEPILLSTLIINISKDKLERITVANPKKKLVQKRFSELVDAYRDSTFDIDCERDESVLLRNAQMLAAYKEGQEWLFSQYCRKLDDGEVRATGVSVNLVRHPISGDIYAFAYVRDIETFRQWEGLLSKPAKRDYTNMLYHKETLAELFHLAANQMSKGNYCAVTVARLVGLERIREERSAKLAENMFFLFSQLCSSMASKEVASALCDESSVVFFRTNIRNTRKQQSNLESQRNWLLKVVKQVFSGIDVGIIMGYFVSDAEGMEFERMLRNAQIACDVAARWPETPVVPYTEEDEADSNNLDVDELHQQKYMYEILIQQQVSQLKLSEFDSLTGLLNRRAFYQNVRRVLDERKDEKFSIVRWDIDNFKMINDVKGLEEGDALLCHISRTIVALCDDSFLAARLEADRFAILLPEKSGKTARYIYDGLVDALREYDKEFTPTIHMGVYEIVQKEDEVGVMCDRALLALRSQKGNFANRIGYYSPHLWDKALEEHQLSGQMRTGLQEGQFQVYLQPQFDYVDKKVIGAEALIRWNHPEKGKIPPGIFIPIFEKNGLITELDEYVWEIACQKLQYWLKKYPEATLPISVNISRVDIDNLNLGDKLTALVEKYEIPTSMLRLEITETAFVDNHDQMIAEVERLQKLGFSVEMDDFGSGYSSLNMLKEIPVNTIKLDMRFLNSGGDSAKKDSIIKSVINMAHVLGLKVIAEGVEKKEEADLLREFNCRYMQGYLFSYPISIREYERLLGMEE